MTAEPDSAAGEAPTAAVSDSGQRPRAWQVKKWGKTCST